MPFLVDFPVMGLMEFRPPGYSRFLHSKSEREVYIMSNFVWMLAIGAVFLSCGLFLCLARLRRERHKTPKGGRLSVSELCPMDGTHQAVLLRCDNQEYLVILGGESPLVVARDLEIPAPSQSALENRTWEEAAPFPSLPATTQGKDHFWGDSGETARRQKGDFSPSLSLSEGEREALFSLQERRSFSTSGKQDPCMDPVKDSSEKEAPSAKSSRREPLPPVFGDFPRARSAQK